MRTDRPHVAGAYRPAPANRPASEDAVHTALSRLFCAETIYAYSYRPKVGGWTVWPTEADWTSTEREGRVRTPELAALGHGPLDMTSAEARAYVGLDAPPVRKLTRAQLVAQLRAVEGLPAAAVALLDAA